MIHLDDGRVIYMEDELPKVLTIDELKEFAQKKPYRPRNSDVFKFHTNDENGLLYTRAIRTPLTNDLVDHLLMEICIQDIDKYDWGLMTDYYDYLRIADYVCLWMTPYTWLEAEDADIFGYLIEGRVAESKYYEFRKEAVYEWAMKMITSRELFLGGHTISFPQDGKLEGGKFLKGMNLWSLLTTNPRKYIQFVFENGRHPVAKESQGLISYFDTEHCQSAIRNIADTKGPDKAARIVRALRKDWKAIVNFKLFNIDKISDQQVEDFRQLLFEGMDYYLEQWDAASSEQPASNGKPAVFEFITDQCYKEGKVEAIEAEMRAACKGTAVAMWKTIRTNEALGYLSTKDVSASKIYKALTNHFGKLPYNERNFRDARNKH